MKNYQILYPPRPEKAVMPALVSSFEKTCFAQIKMNGTCNVITVSPEGELFFHTRHGVAHKAWKPNMKTLSSLTKVKGWTVFIAELMHSKTPHIKDTNYIHDIIVHNGSHLVGKNAIERQDILSSIFPNTSDNGDIGHTIIDNNLWLAKNYMNGFSGLFKSIHLPEHEGLVLKIKNSKLKRCLTKNSNSGQQLKARIKTKNYSF